MRVALALALFALAGCANQSKPRTVADEARLAQCIADEAAKEVGAGVTAQDAAETIAIACGVDTAIVVKDLVFGKRLAPGTKGYVVQRAGRT